MPSARPFRDDDDDDPRQFEMEEGAPHSAETVYDAYIIPDIQRPALPRRAADSPRTETEQP